MKEYDLSSRAVVALNIMLNYDSGLHPSGKNTTKQNTKKSLDSRPPSKQGIPSQKKVSFRDFCS